MRCGHEQRAALSRDGSTDSGGSGWHLHLPALLGAFAGILEGGVDSLERRMVWLESRLDRIEADLREFYRTLGQQDACLDDLEKSGA